MVPHKAPMWMTHSPIILLSIDVFSGTVSPCMGPEGHERSRLGKCTFLTAPVVGDKVCKCIGNEKHWFSCRKMCIFGNRRGSGFVLGTQKYWFSCRKVHIFDGTSGRGQKCANALQTKNIDFLTRKCTFLQTEEDLDVAWERKILIFLQESAHFWQRPW